MFLKLKNATEKFKNETILINPKFIISIFKDINGTTIYSATQETWSVVETPEQIFKMLKNNKEDE